jgi:hypothetical protein
MQVQQTIQQIFKTTDVTTVKDIVKKFPFFETGFIAGGVIGKNEEDLQNAEVLLNNPLWLHYLVHQPKEPVVLAIRETIKEEEKPAIVLEDNKTEVVQKEEMLHKMVLTVPENNAALEIEPYHTVDYFASQGIKLGENAIAKDKLSVQLKSFTEWLKSMKKVDTKLSPEEDKVIDNQHIEVVELAEDSLVKSEILTENMVDVLVKQGKTNEAISLLEKLSLQDQAKSSYFATRIEQLKTT